MKETGRWSLYLGLSLVLAAGAVGCKKEEITRYEVPKGPAPTARTMPRRAGARPNMGGAAGKPAPGGEVTLAYKVPDSWTEADKGSMRIASFKTGEGDGAIDMSVTNFPGAAGGVGPNVNRWRGQLGLAPLEGEALKKKTREVNVGGLKGVFTTMQTEGDTDKAMLATMVTAGGKTWFFKMTGTKAAVNAERENYARFMVSVRFNRPAEPAAVAAGPADKKAAPFKAVTPDGWQQKAISGGMRVGSYKAGDVDISVIRLAGAAGGALANVNRWRGQIGLKPIDEPGLAALQDVKVGDATGKLLDIVSAEEAPQRILAVSLSRAGATWFFKMKGPAEAAKAQTAAFKAFLASVEFEGGAP